MSLGVSLEVVERLVSQYLLHLVDRLKLAYVDVRECGEALSQEEVAPVDAREVLHESVVCHLVVVGLHVAQLYLALACLGDACLDAYCGVGLALSSSLVVAGENEHLLEVFGVSLAHSNHLSVVREVVVALAESESALTKTHEVVGSVLHVGTYADSEHEAVETACVELCCDELILAAVVHVVNLLQNRLQRFCTLAVAAHAVHSEVVERTYLLSECALGLRFRRVLLDESKDALLVHLVEVGERSVASVFCIKRVGLAPATDSILIEVLSGLHCRVHVGEIDAL